MAKNFFDELSETLTKTAQTLSTRMGGVYESQKVNSKIAGEERMIKKLMADMGKIIYERYASGLETDSELVEFCTQIKEHSEKVEALKVESLRKKGQKTCPACGRTVDTGFAFCPFCGAEVPTPEPAEEEEPEEEAQEEELFNEEEVSEKMEEAAQEAADFMEDAAEQLSEAAKKLIDPEE